MHAEPIDPRDIEREVDRAGYRVYFWRTTADDPGAGWGSDEWRLTECDVHEVLTWAADQADGRYVTAWIEAEIAAAPGLIRLCGWEPTRPDRPPEWVTTWA